MRSGAISDLRASGHFVAQNRIATLMSMVDREPWTSASCAFVREELLTPYHLTRRDSADDLLDMERMSAAHDHVPTALDRPVNRHTYGADDAVCGQ